MTKATYKRAHLALWFQRVTIHDGGEEAVGSRHGDWSRSWKFTSWTTSTKHSKIQVAGVFKLSKPTSSDIPPSKTPHFLSLPSQFHKQWETSYSMLHDRWWCLLCDRRLRIILVAGLLWWLHCSSAYLQRTRASGQISHRKPWEHMCKPVI